MTKWQDSVAAAAFEFYEDLERCGFQPCGSGLIGKVDGATSPILVRIVIPDGFPYLPPIAFPPNDFPRSWHRGTDGAMCLYGADGRENLPWSRAEDFLNIVERWLKESETGWPEDSPDLDLERYFSRSSDEPLLVYGELDSLAGCFIRLKRQGSFVRVINVASTPINARQMRRNFVFGYVADIGEPEIPPINWSEIRELLPPSDAVHIENAVRKAQLDYLILRYTRKTIRAVVALHARGISTGISLTSVNSASEAMETLQLRAGFSITTLHQYNVAVIGAGAVGSFLCDLLARSGVGRLAIYDPDIVRPGNLIRHLVSRSSVGRPKPTAIKQVICDKPFNTTDVAAMPERVSSLSKATALFSQFDLVIDATADGSASAMLADAARAENSRLLSVCIQEDGQVIRVDVIPPIEGQAMPPTNPSLKESTFERHFEAGCGDPVSTTAPFAVMEAASLAARFAMNLLTGQPIPPAGVIRDYR